MTEQERVELRGLRSDWDDARTEHLLTRVQTRVTRRTLALRAALAAAALVVVAGGAAITLRSGRGSPSAVASSNGARPGPPGTISLREGSEIRPTRRELQVRVLEESQARVRVELLGGAAHYAVVPNPARTFEVRSGSVSVRVVGTEFVLERRGESTWVEVVRGKVAVSWSGADAEVTLTTGENGLFPEAVTAPVASAASAPEAATPANEERESRRAYRAHLAQKDYKSAFALLAHDPTLVGDNVRELMLAADAARLSDHPAEAVPYLKRVMRDHAADQRAPLAAFTLGRTLSGLGRTREAMDTFARLRSAWPGNALAEDALLRQAEAAARLGEHGTAVRLAEQYDRDYPNGRRRAEVRRHAHLE
jgi:transmembrane sensor